jgi:hypothetical protein
LPEQFPRQPLGSVPSDGPPDSPGGGDSEPGFSTAGTLHKERHQSAGDPSAGFISLLEICASPDVLGVSEPGQVLSLVRDRQPFAAFRTPTLQNLLTVLG